MGTNSVVNYYCLVFIWHWKHLGIWQGNVTQFNESSTYLMGWLRDYLWLGSSQLINGYNPFGMNSLSVWSWVFLAGHLVWAKLGLSFKLDMKKYIKPIAKNLYTKRKFAALNKVQRLNVWHRPRRGKDDDIV